MAEKQYDNLKPRDIPRTSGIWYWAAGNHYADKVNQGAGKVRPSIFMPRWASRIELEITEIRGERLQLPLSQEDMAKEGGESALLILEKINGLWVRVISFRRV